MSLKNWLDKLFGKKPSPALGTKMAQGETCDFCHEQVYQRQGGLQVLSGSSPDFFETLRQAAKRKFICPACASVFCLECGNNKGHQLGTGSTHCPKCGFKVL